MNASAYDMLKRIKAGPQESKVKVFKKCFKIPRRLVYWQILLAIKFLVSKNPPLLGPVYL